MVSVFERKRPFDVGLDGCVAVDGELVIGKRKGKCSEQWRRIGANGNTFAADAAFYARRVGRSRG